MSHQNTDLETLAVSSIILNEDIGEYVNELQPKWIYDSAVRRVWNLAVAYYQDHRENVPREVVRAEVPEFKFRVGSGSSVEGVLETLQDSWLRGSLEDIYEDEVITMEDPAVSIATIIGRLSVLQASIQRDTGCDISETIHESIDRYRDRKAGIGVLGLPYCWAPLQRETSGAQLGEFILIYARMKQQKTFVMLKQLQHWVKYCKRRVLLVAHEMTVHQLQDRFLCIWSGVNYKPFRKGEQTPVEEEKVEQAAQEVIVTGKVIVESVTTLGLEAAQEIHALAGQYGLEEGDVIAVDGMELFCHQQSDWKQLREFSSGIKSIAMGGSIEGKGIKYVVIATCQANQNLTKDSKQDAGKEMSGGDGPVRNCDVALKLQFNKQDLEIIIDVPAIREGESIRFTINAIPCSDYSLKYSDDPEEDRDTQIIPAPGIRAKKITGTTGTTKATKDNANTTKNLGPRKPKGKKCSKNLGGPSSRTITQASSSKTKKPKGGKKS